MKNNLKDKFKQALKENANPDPVELEKQSLPRSIFIIPSIAFIVILFATYLINPYAGIDFQGKIESPKAGSETEKEVKVIGETKNIEPGQYIWLAVDKPGIGLCWPKTHIASNTKFSTTILEEGPKETFFISLYVLNENFHNQWKDWQNRKIFGGVHLPPESKRIDSIELILKD